MASIRGSQLPKGTAVQSEDYLLFLDYPALAETARNPVMKRVLFSDFLGTVKTDFVLKTNDAIFKLDNGTGSPLFQSNTTQIGIGVAPYVTANAILTLSGNIRVGGNESLSGHAETGVSILSSEALLVLPSGSLTGNAGYAVSKIRFDNNSATGATVVTLPDGIINQEKTVVIESKVNPGAGSVRITPTHRIGTYSYVTLTNVGSIVTFQMLASGWVIKSYNDASII
jgi:hypothetical protein